MGSKAPSASAGSHSVKAGDLVSIKPGSTYYNGVAIPDWVMADRWYVRYLSGDRAVIRPQRRRQQLDHEPRERREPRRGGRSRIGPG